MALFQVRVRKALSEDARMRDRFLKAAMEAINEEHWYEVEFYPSWNENAVREYRAMDTSFGCTSAIPPPVVERSSMNHISTR